MYVYKRKKTKVFDTKKEAEDKAVELGLIKKIEKDWKGNDVEVDALKEGCEYCAISKNEETNEVMSEKIITEDAEFVEDKDVDTTVVHLCDHDENGRGTEDGCKLRTVAEGLEFKKDREISEKELVEEIKQ